MLRTILITLLLGACVSQSNADTETTDLSWLTGCWESSDGSAREVWSSPEDGLLFGYAVTRAEGKLVFFEQMRIDPAPVPTFSAYPAGRGPSAFPAVDIAPSDITFANPAHDYPQKIRYYRDGPRLKAVISLIDGSRPGTFEYGPCPAATE